MIVPVVHQVVASSIRPKVLVPDYSSCVDQLRVPKECGPETPPLLFVLLVPVVRRDSESRSGAVRELGQMGDQMLPYPAGLPLAECALIVDPMLHSSAKMAKRPAFLLVQECHLAHLHAGYPPVVGSLHTSILRPEVAAEVILRRVGTRKSGGRRTRVRHTPPLSGAISGRRYPRAGV